jgi:hypothetical protein
MTIVFPVGAGKIFAQLPGSVKSRAARSIELLPFYSRMYPLRRRGIMRGYRYFVALGFLFYLFRLFRRDSYHSNPTGPDATGVT